jgi:hypothetical protein
MASSTPTFFKDPSDILDYAFDWSQWLGLGETIATSTWLPSPGIIVNSTNNTSTVTTVWLSGGTAGIPYTVKNTMTTNQGRTVDRTLTIRVTNL